MYRFCNVGCESVLIKSKEQGRPIPRSQFWPVIFARDDLICNSFTVLQTKVQHLSIRALAEFKTEDFPKTGNSNADSGCNFCFRLQAM
jgi:hypothetical protein